MTRTLRNHISPRRVLVVAAVLGALALALGLLTSAAPAKAAQAQASPRPLHLTAVQPQFTSFTCLKEGSNGSCLLASATLDGKDTSNLSTGAGPFHADLIIDFSPGGTCNIVTENDTFGFDNGTILVHSYHEDCATQGLRIDTTFQVTGGTGAFEGASGGGREFRAFPKFPNITSPTPVNFEGTISF